MSRTSLAAGLLTVALNAATLETKLLDRLEWRSIGPAVMGGRISDIAGIPGDPVTMFVAAGSGGVFVTHNGGITWKPIFDRQSTISIGALAVEPGNPKVIWAGTGESNVRNSVSFGDGVYQSEDGGETWKCMGLRDAQTISKLIISPSNPKIVYVAAVGHPFGSNPERGVFMTEDGGRTWKKTLFIDDGHGASDLEIDPSDPKVLYAGMWRFERKPWTYTSGSENGGVYQSLDGGRTWKKLTAGLPRLMGRIGVKVAPSNPKIVYVIAESRDGTLFRSDDRGATFTRISDARDLIGRGYYYSSMRVSPIDENQIFVLTDSLLQSKDAGRSFRRISPQVHGDLHALWIDPKDPRRIWQGHDGGLATSADGGSHWEQVNNIPLGQFYRVSADNRKPFYNVIGGTQDNGSWTGPSQTREPAGIFNDDWRMVNGIVGFGSLVDSDDPDLVLTETPGGGLLRTNLRTREQQSVSPQPRSNSGSPAREWKYRFGWDAPLLRSPFGSKTIYFAANVIFQSSDGGRTWENISPDLTTNDLSKQGNIGGPISVDNSTSEIYSTISALAESPAKQGTIWAGTDDGNLQVSVNGGGQWTNVAANLPGAPQHSRVSHIEPSRRDALVAYVTFDHHMMDDFRPYIFKTADGGQSWKDISSNIPSKAFVRVVREDARNADVLYAGTELGIYASITAGAEWFPLHLKNLPYSIAVRDIVQHPETNDLILATHGRSLWVFDDATVFQQLADALKQDSYLFDIRPALRYTTRATRFGFGDKLFTGPNRASGAQLTYYLVKAAPDLKLQVLDRSGAVIREIPAPNLPGVNRVSWDLRYDLGQRALPGSYRARLTSDGRVLEKGFQVQLDPALQVPPEDLVAQFLMSREIREIAAKVRAGNPRLVRNLDSLFNMVESANAAPTPAMTRYFNELKAESQSAAARP